MNNASPCRSLSHSLTAVSGGGGLAPLNVLDADIEDAETSPFSQAENLAGEADAAGFFIGLVTAVAAGLAFWAAAVTAWILL